jgi:hypothetical protein
MLRNFRECGPKGYVKECTELHHFATKGRHLLLEDLLRGNEDVPAIYGGLSWFR